MFSINYELANAQTYIYFGGYESSKVSESTLTWVPISGNGHWEIEFQQLQFEGFNAIKNPSPDTGAILDTGTSLTYFIPSVYV